MSFNINSKVVWYFLAIAALAALVAPVLVKVIGMQKFQVNAWTWITCSIFAAVVSTLVVDSLVGRRKLLHLDRRPRRYTVRFPN